MAQPCKHKDLSLISPRASSFKTKWKQWSIVITTGEAKTGASWGLLVSQPSLVSKFEATERHCLKNNKAGQCLINDT